MIELESHAKAKRSELPLGFGNPADCVASYNPQKGLISLTVANGEKHNYVLLCTYADWKLLNERITVGLSFLHAAVEIPPHEAHPAPPQPEPQAQPEPPTPEPQQDTKPAATSRPYFSKEAKEARATEAVDDPQESRGLPPLADEGPAPEFDPATGEIIR